MANKLAQQGYAFCYGISCCLGILYIGGTPAATLKFSGTGSWAICRRANFSFLRRSMTGCQVEQMDYGAAWVLE